jgi:hypothetical protein
VIRVTVVIGSCAACGRLRGVSSALAVASVSAVLKNVLEDRLVTVGLSAPLGDPEVSTLPPDRAELGADDRSRLNLFLYRVAPNSGWRSGGHTGTTRPALALDLYYLVTAYGGQDFVAEILLGEAMQTLLEMRVLSSDAIRRALAVVAPDGNAGIVSGGRSLLSKSNLADQAEQITITPEFMSTEELSRMWSALQARYRPSVAYKVSAALIQAGA